MRASRSPGFTLARCVGTGMLALAAASLAPAAAAQVTTTTLAGSVRDSAGHAVTGVAVSIQGSQAQGRTDDLGGFRMAGVPVGLVRVSLRRMGFTPTHASVTLRPGRIDSLVITLSAVAVAISGVTVEDDATTLSHRMLAGFWERRSRGFGSFLTRDEVEARHPQDFPDLVRMVPSVKVTDVNGRRTVRFRRDIGTRDCPPQFWVDGMRLERAEADELNPWDIEGVEIYPGASTIPPQFAARPNSFTCGAVIVWTRLGGREGE